MDAFRCGWNNCKFNESGMCYQEVHVSSPFHHHHKEIYNKNSEEIKQNCRCLHPDL